MESEESTIKLELTNEDFEIVCKSVFHNLKRMKDITKMQQSEQMEVYKEKVETLFNKLYRIRKQKKEGKQNDK